MFLFPLKERYSAIFEKEMGYPNGQPEEYSLAYQAVEETRLFLFYLTAQLSILWIGYYPYEWTRTLSIVLSYFFLFFTFGLDLISPTLQRHKINYAKIVKLLTANPVLTLGFGLVYSLPVVLLSFWVFSNPEWSLTKITSVLFFLNLLAIALAITGGTKIATQLVPLAKQLPAIGHQRQAFWYGLMGLVLVISATLHATLVSSMHHKSQILKAGYDVQWSSIDIDLPSLEELRTGKAFGSLSVDLEITNPTEFDIIIEKSRLLIDNKGKRVSGNRHQSLAGKIEGDKNCRTGSGFNDGYNANRKAQ